MILISLLPSLIILSLQDVGLLTCLQGDDIILGNIQGKDVILGHLEMFMMDSDMILYRKEKWSVEP